LQKNGAVFRERTEGKSANWVLGHVRVGKEQVIAEIEAAGFRLVSDSAILKENFYLRFKRRAALDKK
jgi:hypothetical protein